MIGTRKKGVTEILEKMKKREVKVQFKREPLIIFQGPNYRLDLIQIGHVSEFVMGV